MATYVLVHGGGHGGWCYKKVKRLLETAGHEVFAPTMAGLAERSNLLSPEIDLDHHIDDIVAELFYWDLDDVILAGHSYGGMIITGVADRTDRVGKLVYLDAAYPSDGQSLAALTGEMITSLRPLSQVVDDTELVMLPETYDRMWQVQDYFGVSDPAEREWLKARLTGQPWRTFEQPLRLRDEAAVRAIPDYHIVCQLAAREAGDPQLYQRLRAQGRLWHIDTGHDLMITEPQLLADALEQIARD